jgi:hypothetical protein
MVCAAVTLADANPAHNASMILVRIDFPLCQEPTAYNEFDQRIKRT